jgi:hypothetical protein
VLVSAVIQLGQYSNYVVRNTKRWFLGLQIHFLAYYKKLRSKHSVCILDFSVLIEQHGSRKQEADPTVLQPEYSPKAVLKLLLLRYLLLLNEKTRRPHCFS